MIKPHLYMVFDVESVGLHGEGFAVGWVVVNEFGVEIQHGLLACHHSRASGTPEAATWVDANVPKMPEATRCYSPFEVRDRFWLQWRDWYGNGALLVADCCWPVEARFLAACIDDSPVEREWKGPYPLHDVASIILAAGGDPMVKSLRKENELPEHNPLCDARQSARLLIEALNSIHA